MIGLLLGAAALYGGFKGVQKMVTGECTSVLDDAAKVGKAAFGVAKAIGNDMQNNPEKYERMKERLAEANEQRQLREINKMCDDLQRACDELDEDED